MSFDTKTEKSGIKLNVYEALRLVVNHLMAKRKPTVIYTLVAKTELKFI